MKVNSTKIFKTVLTKHCKSINYNYMDINLEEITKQTTYSLTHLKEVRDRTLRNFLLLIGVPKDVLTKYNGNGFSCILYVNEDTYETLKPLEDLFRPDFIMVKNIKVAEKGITVELNSVVEGQIITDVIVTRIDLKTKAHVESYKTVIDPYGRERSEKNVDQMLAAVMALQFGASDN